MTLRILAWLRSRLRYGGPVGSRQGPVKALAAGQGRCWDYTDVFVTLCRQAGIPARQVAGWLAGTSGHIWAQVWLGSAWFDVDPTCTWLGVSEDYIPLALSEDGSMEFAYWGPPKIARIK